MRFAFVLMLAIACDAQTLDPNCPGLTKPGVACNDKGLVCLYDGTECQHCTCDGEQFVCENSASCTGDGGPWDAGKSDVAANDVVTDAIDAPSD
jgi:hypothetical protein